MMYVFYIHTGKDEQIQADPDIVHLQKSAQVVARFHEHLPVNASNKVTGLLHLSFCCI